MIAFLFRFAVRTLTRRRARSSITLCAIALGVACLIFLGSIMIGVNDAMIASSIALRTGAVLVRTDRPENAAARLGADARLSSHITAMAPRLLCPAMLMNGEAAASAQIIAVNPDSEVPVSAAPSRIDRGRYLSASDTNGICIGAEMAGQVGAEPGDVVDIQLSDGRRARATVVGVFRTGVPSFDMSVVYAPLEWLKELSPPSMTGEVAVFVNKGIDSRGFAERMRLGLVDSETATAWEDLLPELEQLTRLNVVSMFIVVIIVVIMMAAGVSNTMLVSVLDRFREFGILKALGVTPWEVAALAMIESAAICLVAGIAGLVVGCAATLVASQVGIDLTRFTSENPHFVLTSVVYPRLTWSMTVAPTAIVLVAGLLASLWPAGIAARRRAAEVIRRPV